MAEDSTEKDQEHTPSEKPEEEGTPLEIPDQEDSAWIRWVKETSTAMNRRFTHYNRNFFKNLKKRARR